jgi:hypothetical protein
MAVRTDGCTLSTQQIAALTTGAAAMSAPNADVIVTTNFVPTIARLTGNTQYNVDRGAGTVGGKTVRTSSGDHFIVINWTAVRRYDLPELERLLAHEAGHVLLGRRNEIADGRQYLASSEVDWEILCLGGFAAEEFRIERDLCDLGYDPAESVDPSHMNDVLYDLNMSILDAVAGPSSQTVTAMRDSVMRAANNVSKALANLAAATITEKVASIADQLDDFGRPNWDDYLAPTWSSRLTLYRTFPAAREPLAMDWDQALVELMDLERQQLRVLGFTYLGHPGGFKFHRIGTDQLFAGRVSRGLAEGRSRGDI